jgi:hypothetical protein
VHHAGTRFRPANGGGVPLAWTLTGGNRNHVIRPLELLDRVPPVRRRVGRPRRRPRTSIADRWRRLENSLG